MRITKISYEPMVQKSIQEKILKLSVLNKNNINPDKIFTHYIGRDLVSFKSEKTFSQTIKKNYFKLPKGFYPDEFQIAAGKEINNGKDVLVEAPTGTGKTAIAHYAVSRNMDEGKKTFYTTPLKALSNQKLNEFGAVYGDENVGILTGDKRKNIKAPIIVMTTEVYRNMALSNMYGNKNPLMDNLGTVIFDEFHYLGDKERGPVWEESLMYSPSGIQTLELSATIGNPEELKNWIDSLDNNNASLISVPPEKRHVPLIFNMLETGAYKAEQKRNLNSIKKKGYADNDQSITISKPTPSDFKAAVNTLSHRDQLPAILFVFSKNFSRDLLDYLSSNGKSLTTEEEKKEIQKIIDKYKSQDYLGANLNEKALINGYAIHNSGIIPAQKELVEELFQKKLLKTVIATETLAAGINMPARTVVISSPYKPTNSDTEETNLRLLTPNEFKQMAGRAGRRGIDTQGYVYTMPTNTSSEQDFLVLEASASNPIESKYSPDYAFLSGFFEYNDDISALEDIYNKSFYVHSSSEEEKQTKLSELMNLSGQRTKVLLDRGFLNKQGNNYFITQKGCMASKVRGYDTLTLVETIANKTFKDITPEALAAVAAVIANPVTAKEPEIGTETDMHEIISQSDENILKVLLSIDKSISAQLKNLGTDFNKFNSLEEMLEYARKIEKPDENIEELRRKLKEKEALRAKRYTITATSGNYTEEQLLEAIKNKQTVPSKVLEKHLNAIQQYKKGINAKDLETYIEKLQTEYNSLDSSAKGNKVKARIEKKRNELNKQITRAQILKELDALIPDELQANFKFLKSNSPEKVKDEYYKAETEYTKAAKKDDLISQIEAAISIDKYLQEHNLNEESNTNTQKIHNCMNRIINTALDINQTEIKNNINNVVQKYGKNELKAMYYWALLNKMNKESLYNWYEILKIVPEKDIDEGGIYRITMQTADLLSQIGEIAEAGAKSTENIDDINYYLQLKKTATEARKLIINSPVKI